MRPSALLCLWLALAPASVAAERCTVAQGHAAYAGKRDGRDLSRTSIPVELTPVLTGCGDVVDVQFVPGSSSRGLVVDQKGRVHWFDLDSATTGLWLELEVAEGWEKGLLGAAFHPRFADSGRVFFHYTAEDGGLKSRIGSFRVDPSSPWSSAPVLEHLVYELAQPYGNHNGGGLVFGPDGMLYIGFGDGGKANDPHGHGQNGGTALGAMLRLDVDGPAPYQVPADNPFVGVAGVLPEVWATGLRNPWRYTFDGSGRLVVADVGQNTWEEVGFVVRGGNSGWNAREAAHCFEPSTGCRTEGLTEPLWEYGRDDGQSVTGGVVVSSPEALAGRYLVADFATGRIWAIELPAKVGKRAQSVATLGRFPVKISAFARDGVGRAYVAGWTDGRVYRLGAP